MLRYIYIAHHVNFTSRTSTLNDAKCYQTCKVYVTETCDLILSHVAMLNNNVQKQQLVLLLGVLKQCFSSGGLLVVFKGPSSFDS